MQLFVSFAQNQDDALLAFHRLESCITDVSVWLSSNSLKLNSDKSELFMFGSKSHLAKINVNSINVTLLQYVCERHAEILGSSLTQHMSMSHQVSNICKSIRFQLRNLGVIRKYLTHSATEKLVRALILTCLDFCNSLLYQLPCNQLDRLQRLQNSTARIVTRAPPQAHITLIFHSLHWPPVAERIKYKLLLLVFHC